MNEELEQYIARHQKNREKSESFVDYLYELMKKHQIENPSDVYKKAFLSRQLYSSIISAKSSPSLNTCIKLALAMHLDNHECKYLLKKAGYTLSSSSRFSLIIRFAIEKHIYDIYEVNKLLIDAGYEDSLLL